MDLKIFKRYAIQADILKAIAHPTRLFIIDELSKNERCVCELQQKIGSDMSTVSKHLSILKNANIVEIEKRNNKVIYQLKIPCVINFFDCIDSVLKSSAKKELEILNK